MSILALLLMICDLGPLALLALAVLLVTILIVLADLLKEEEPPLRFPALPNKEH